MKIAISIALAIAFASPSIYADDDSPAISQDPRLRAVYFYARTHRPFDALAGLSVAQMQGVGLSGSAELNAAIDTAVIELGLDEKILEASSFAYRVTGNGHREESPIYTKYNHGVSLLKSSTPLDGVKVLSEISAGEYLENDEKLLKDRANLTLGYYLLETGDQRGAINYFRQVRRLSIYANRALVGLGWALLSPNTGLEKNENSLHNSSDATADYYLWSGSDDELAWSRRDAPFRRAWAVAKGEKEKDLRAAMVPWMELISRDPLDPAVQEVMLIIPYLMLHWDGQQARSEQYYISAVGRLKRATSDLVTIEKDIRSGGLIKSIQAADANQDNGWEIWLSDLTASRLGGYISILLDTPGFREALDEFRQLDRIHMRLESVLAGGAEAPSALREEQAAARALLAKIEQHRAHWSSVIEQLALKRVVEHRNRTEAYSAEAEFALARNYERLRQSLSSVMWSENES
jgi:hypothetical protein